MAWTCGFKRPNTHLGAGVSDTNRGDVGGELGTFVLNPGLGGLEPDMRPHARIAGDFASVSQLDWPPLRRTISARWRSHRSTSRSIMFSVRGSDIMK